MLARANLAMAATTAACMHMRSGGLGVLLLLVEYLDVVAVVVVHGDGRVQHVRVA